jgi:threonylcarbamoyladenosine tRNA methylthiotransferase MtaB
MARSDKLCNYFHVPMQSGDDSVLNGMNRRYSVDEYREFVEGVARRVPDVGLGTDLIVGFPGETEESFDRTEKLLEELPLSYFHVFSYSKRYGTRAAREDGHVAPEVIKERSRRLRTLSRRKRRAFAERYIGRPVEVLFEQQDENGLWTGLTDNYLRISVVSSRPLRNTFADVVLQEVTDDIALGVLAAAAAA